MRFLALLLVSFVAQSSSQVLQVKCGDEKCERPSNKAVTTLRYTPDKPYKLQILAVNSEVEIFGMTDDLYYIRHGKNFGFLPKNHLREKARGNYPFSVEIDISNKRIDQQVREKNFLHEFLQNSQAAQVVLKNNDTVVEVAKPLNETLSKPLENLQQGNLTADSDSQVKTEEIPLDKKTDDKTNFPADEKKLSVESQEEANDSGIDDEADDEDDEDDDEDDEEDSIHERQEQPELVAIPPGKNTDLKSDEQSSMNVENPSSVPVVATVAEEVNSASIESNNVQNETVTEKVPDFVPIQPEVVEKSAEPLEPKIVNDVIQALDQNTEIPKVVQEEIKVVPDVVKVEEATVSDQIPVDKNDNSLKDAHTLNSSDSSLGTQEPVINSNPELIPVIETVTDLPPIDFVTSELPPVLSELPPVPYQFETTQSIEVTTEHQSDLELKTQPLDEQLTIPQVIEVTTESQKHDEPRIQSSEEALATPHYDIPVTTQVPDNFEIPVQETIKEEKEIIEEVPPPPPLPLLQKKPVKVEPDALLQKFNEKLGNRFVENSEKEVEPVHKHVDSEIHYDVNNHVGNEQKSSEEFKNSPDLPLELEEEKAGFFGGLVSKFFGNKEDSEEHLDDKVENSFNPAPKANYDSGFCEKIDSENCPQSLKVQREPSSGQGESEWKTADEYLRIMLNETIEMMDLIVSMGLTGLTVLIFTLGYYCINKARKEGPLIAKMNELERHLMASVKENEILKADIIATRQKLLSIEDNSFGSNEMVIDLKRDLELSEQSKNELSEKIASLEKELEAAAEDGLELNRMVSELLSNQTGSESIISSVEELQRQLNEQQETIITMNEALATKSRENSELQIQLSEINGKFQGDFQSYQHQIDSFTLERSNLQIELENLKRESDVQVNQLIEERNGEVTRLNIELTSYAKNYEDAKKSLNTAESKVQALEECLSAIKKDSKGTVFKELFDVADLKADLLAVTKEKSTLQEQLQIEKDSRKLLEDRVKTITEEMSDLKKEFDVAEKEKLEAQTRLEVLSTYFKEKETQLQRELSVKEARWMKQQGETTSTVEKVQSLNTEIQGLKSQNDSLRAEIEAQVTAHKLNIASHEAQSHAAWLNARQAERKLEESRMESAALRRRLTLIAENPTIANDALNGLPVTINDSMNLIPSPIRVESPNTTNNMPPAPMMLPPFLPQGFMPGAPPPFLPPPPFMPGEMVPPLGRLMSPPPKRFTPTMRDDRDRYSPRGRGRYSPDSRYDDYTAFETETDYSPPPSPSPPRRGYNSQSDRSKKSKGGHSSTGSMESNPTSRRKNF